MNLAGIAAGYIDAVNERIPVSVQVSTGSSVDGSGNRMPAYASPVTVPGQVQPLSYSDIQQVDGLNLQGTRRSIYLFGRVNGLVRSLDKGGDLITVSSGVNAGTWLVALVSEAWPDWTKCIVTLQNN